MNAHMTQPRRSIAASGSGSLFQSAYAEAGKRFRRTGELFRLISLVTSAARSPFALAPPACQSLIQRLVSALHFGQRWVASCNVFSDSELFREMRTIKTRQLGHVTNPMGWLTSPLVSRRCRTNCASTMSSSSRTKTRAAILFWRATMALVKAARMV